MKLVEIENPEDSEPFPGRMILDKAVELIRKRERITVFLCILLAFAVRLFAFSSKYPITGDGVWYATLGKNLAAGNVREGLSTYWPPLYPVLIGVSSLVFGDVELSGRIVSVSAGSLLVIPTYLLARTFYGRSVALLTVLILAIHPSIVFYSTAVLTESTYLLFFISGIYAAFVAFSTGRISAFVLTGIAFGACYLLKPEAIGYALLLVLLSGSMKLINRQLTSRKIIINTLALAFTFFLIALPYLIFLQQQTGHWTISDKFVVMNHSFPGWRKLIDSEQLTSADKYWGGWSATTYQPAGNNSTEAQDVPSVRPTVSPFIVWTLIRLYEIPRKLFDLLTPFMVVLAGLGLFSQGWDRERFGKEVYLGIIVIATLLGYGLVIGPEVRYFIPMLVIVLIWVAKGILEFDHWLTSSLEKLFHSGSILQKGRMFLRPLVFSLFIISLLPALVAKSRSQAWDPMPIATWIKNNTKASPLIMSANPWPAFYSEGKHLYLPNEEYSRVIEHAENKHVDLIIVEESGISMTPKLNFLLDEQSLPSGLKLLFKSETMPKHKVLIWALTDPAVTTNRVSP